MVSEIKSSAGHAAQALGQALQKPAEPAASVAAAAPPSAEVVTVTDLGQRLQKLSDSVANLPVVDQNRVNELRESLASGNYQINDEQIAEKLTALENLLGTGKTA